MKRVLLAAVVVVVLDVSRRPLTQLPAPESDNLAEIPFVLVRQEVSGDKAIALATPRQLLRHIPLAGDQRDDVAVLGRQDER